MQTYNVINNELTGAELPGKIYENLQSLKSEFSGTSFPTENLVAGMKCYRTDEGKVYRLMPDLNTWEIENNFSGLWEDNEQVKVGDVRYLSDRKYAGYILECIQAGTTGNAEPVVSDSDVDNATDLEGFSGTLQIAHGGTGATSVAGARNALGLGNTTGALPVANGGTGATTAEGARSNLGLTYATQAEAEAGTDNTKIMTPKGVNYRLNKDRQLKTYSNVTQWGLNLTSVSIKEIADAMPDYSQLMTHVTTEVHPNLGLPKNGWKGTLFMQKDSSGRTAVDLIGEGDWGNYRGMSATWLSVVDWKKLATQGALSMPSSSHISIDKSLTSYTAPADGWLKIYWSGSSSKSWVFVDVNKGCAVAALTVNSTGSWNSTCVPMSKGTKATVTLHEGAIAEGSVFYYAQSEV